MLSTAEVSFLGAGESHSRVLFWRSFAFAGFVSVWPLADAVRQQTTQQDRAKFFQTIRGAGAELMVERAEHQLSAFEA